MWSFKSICILSFILIGCCVSELHAYSYVPIVKYDLRLFIVVEIHFLLNCLHVSMIRVRGFITSPSFVALHVLAKCIA